jgi:ABC-type multidrug transport system permease subunit
MGISSLFSILGKDAKLFRRPIISALIIILAPVLIILLAGIVFNSSGLSNVIIGVHADSYTDLTENLIKDFQNQGFTINRYELKEECIESVKLGKTQICAIFPDDLSETGSVGEVVFYADQSRLNLAYNLIHDVETRVSTKASSIGSVLAQDLINTLDSVKENLPKRNEEISISKTNADEINEGIDPNAFNVDINKIIVKLESVKDSMNDSTNAKSVSDIITDLEAIKGKIYNNLNDIEDQSKDISSNLDSISSEIDLLVSSINNRNVLEAEKIVSPIKTKIEPISANSNNKDYLIPTIIALIALFGGILLSSTLVLREKKTRAYIRNFITPTWDFTFILGSYLTCLIILSLQFLLVFAGVIWILGTPLLPILPNILVVLFVSLSVFIFLGMFIGYIFRSEETTIFAAVLIAAILMFFSNTIIPIETISGTFNKFAIFNPLVVSEIALKKVILFEFGISSVLPELYILGGFLLTFIVLTYIGRKITKRML